MVYAFSQDEQKGNCLYMQWWTQRLMESLPIVRTSLKSAVPNWDEKSDRQATGGSVKNKDREKGRGLFFCHVRLYHYDKQHSLCERYT